MKFPFLLIIALLLPLQAEDQPAKPIKPNQPPKEMRSCCHRIPPWLNLPVLPSSPAAIAPLSAPINAHMREK